MEKYDYTKLKALRDEKKLTQKQMGEILCMTQSAYNKLEKGIRKNDSLQTIEKLAIAFELTQARLISILTNQDNIRSAGIKESDAWQVQKLLKNNPLREDEFIFFTAELLDIDKYSFQDKFVYIDGENIRKNDRHLDVNYPPQINILISEEVGVGFEDNGNELTGISIWLGDEKLGIISEDRKTIVSELIHRLMISRILLIENEDSIAGSLNTYMKVVFIATNAIAKTMSFGKGRFTSLQLLTENEIKQLEEDAKEVEHYY
jgi:transcriptional regulator with XRE-family HTH domain